MYITCTITPVRTHSLIYTHTDAEIAGVTHWQRPQPNADGFSLTLYEHKIGSTQHHGDPIADVYAIVARPNSCILVVADGVNWGIKPRLAARCAVHGSIDHLNTRLFDSSKPPRTTQDVFHGILRSFHSAQRMIIDHGGTTTTLCVAVIVELQHPKGPNKWGVCVVSVGDTLCYVWKRSEQQVYELTAATHAGKDRNPTDCGGCLGCDLGDRPDLSNLLCCFVTIADGDIVFSTSDGVSDNVDPVLLKEALSDGSGTPLSTPVTDAPPFPQDNAQASQDGLTQSLRDLVPSLPVVTAEQRQALAMSKLSSILREKSETVGHDLSATCVKDALITHVIEVTEEKRKYLEQCWLEQDKKEQTMAEKRAMDRIIGQKIKTLPGKLDHASVAAYRVGKLFAGSQEELVQQGHSPTHSHHMMTALGLKGQSQECKSFSSAGGSIFYTAPSVSSKRKLLSPQSPSTPPPLSQGMGTVSFPG